MTADIRTAIRSLALQLMTAHAKLTALSDEQRHEPRAHRLRDEMDHCGKAIMALSAAQEACDG